MHESLKEFPVIIEHPVVWGEMDAYQHVNHTVYFRYFETARFAYFDRVMFREYREKTGIGPILASIQCRFRIPLTYPDTVSVGTRVIRLDEDRFTMEHKLISRQHSKVAAECSALIVTFDYANGRKVPIPAELRQRILELEGK